MKKSLKVITSVAMAVSMFSSIEVAANAATTTTSATVSASKTSANFKDLANVDAALKLKIDALLEAGVFNGVSKDYFGISQNMTRAQAAKVLTLIYNIKVDMTVTTSSFNDVKGSDKSNGWAIPYIEAAKKAGLITGVTDNAFVPGGNVTLGQLAKLLVAGLGKKVDTTGTPWYKEVISQAVDLKLLSEGTNGAQIASRANIVEGAYGASNLAAKNAFSDEELVKRLPGFQNRYKKVNGVKLHYVEGGKGEPLFLLPGWPQTWYSFHKVMPELAKHYHVYSIDYRGMGSSDKPESGYDKKTLAADIHSLVKELGYEKVNVAGHDIGSMVAYAYAAQYPEATKKLAMLDVPHPNDRFLKIPLLSAPSAYDLSNPDRAWFPWWFALNSIPGLPEQLLQGKQADIVHNWIFDYQLYNKASMTAEDKAIYNASYDSPEEIRASNGWYKTYRKDIDDLKTYNKLSVPVLGIGGAKFGLDPFLRENATDFKVVNLEKTGHWIAEENPQETIKLFIEFFQ
ncbi:alpha/beta fold hydrolase [Paenibacillus sp. R14(2021)]|uniref:alpha/beta fold hydrolase n=1 Tax=Paenibacillus sp. R14(2021) TaxID=2859228 RepID=UPI001C611DE5|nr:alpha/beta fold hydrolase [Paenibacillus sp. R14(2021)]